MYEVYASTEPAFPAALTSAIFTQSFSANFTSLIPNSTYYVQVRANYAEGDDSALAGPITVVTPQESVAPTVNDQQAGDDQWRKGNSGTYAVFFDDLGGSHLSHFQVQISTNANGSPVLVPYTNVVAPGALVSTDTYATQWSLPPAVFSQLMQGVTNYAFVRVFDMAGNSSAPVNSSFYVKVDTTTPTIISSVTLAFQSQWRNADPGAAYDVRFFEAASGLDTLQYSASLNPGTADQSVIPWTNIATLLNTTSYTNPFAVNFTALSDSATNYVSLRAWSIAGSTSAVYVDAFRVLKATTPPTVGLIDPTNNSFRSALTAVSGTAASAIPIQLAEISIQDLTGGSYWDAPTNGFNSGVPVFYPSTGWR